MKSVNRSGILILALGALVSAAAGAATKQAHVSRRYDPKKSKIGDGALVHITDSGTRYDHVTKQQYIELRDASIALMKKYPPDKHVYIGLGRDPAPFIAFLQEIGAEAHNFPASGQGHTASARLDRHFEKLIPASVRRGSKTILLIDQTRSGKTHQSMMPLLKDYLKRSGSKVDVKGVAFNSGGTVSLSVPGLRVIDTSPFPEVMQFFYAPYEGIVSPFERHTPSTQNVSELQWRPQYDKYRNGLGQRIERDPELDRFLASYAPNPRSAANKPRPSRPAGSKPSRETAWGLTSVYDSSSSSLGNASTLTLKRKKQTYKLLDQTQYDDLAWGAQELLTRHPGGAKGGRFYLGVGRSASAIVAFLENLGAQNVGYLPADGLKQEKTISPQLQAEFDKYFAKFIPKAALTRGDTITLFQQSDSGATLKALKPMLDKYIAGLGSKSKVELVAYTTKQMPAGVNSINTRGKQTLQELNGDAFKTAAVYSYHRIGTDKMADVKDRRDHYDEFKQALLQRMETDQGLDDFLQKDE